MDRRAASQLAEIPCPAESEGRVCGLGFRAERQRAVTSDIEANKEASVDAAAALTATRCGPDESGPARAFVATFYEHAPPADIAARSAEDLCGGALALWRFGARRKPSETRIRVYNPAMASDGWSSPHTIVEIVNDDMPFLVDSTIAAINDSDGGVRLVIHPVIAVVRDSDGNLTALGPKEGGLRESWMQIEITREPSSAKRSALADTLVGSRRCPRGGDRLAPDARNPGRAARRP